MMQAQTARAGHHSGGLCRRSARACCSPTPVAPTSKPVAVPSRSAEQTTQAAEAIIAGFRDGRRRQQIELLLPLIGATDLDDWPGGVKQQFKAAQPIVEAILKNIKKTEGLEGPLTPEIWDQGDAVACWRSPKLAAVVFPTAATIKRLRELTEGPSAPALVVVVNPQWEGQGNIISDFGFGSKRADNEKFITTFETSYFLRQQRIYGDVVRVVRGHPNEYQAFVGGPGNSPTQLLLQQPARPTYQQLEDALRALPSASINKSVAQRIQEEFYFNRDTLDQR